MVAVIAVIVFQKIHTPGCKGVRIDKFMLEAAWISGIGQVARTRIHTKFQAFGMHVIRNRFHAVGELLRICNQTAFLCLSFLKTSSRQ